MLERNPSKASSFPGYPSYLDVSEYILKEYSPHFKPSSPHLPHAQEFPSQESLELQPLELDRSQIVLTPITRGLIRLEVQDMLDDFMLEESMNEPQTGGNPSKGKRRKVKSSPGLELFRFECDLDKIMEYDGEQSYEQEICDSQQSGGQEEVDLDNCHANSNTFHTVWPVSQAVKAKTTQDTEEQNLTTFDILAADYSENIERFTKNPKADILKKIKQIESKETNEDQKRVLLKNVLESYLLQSELFHFQATWLDLTMPFQHIITLIKQGLDETFGRKVGPISFEQRRVKLLKYLQKKKRRIWKKKVSYDCRKKVADGRLRIKGKFVTREQACEQLGLDNLDDYNAQEIKGMLERKMEDRLFELNC